MSDNGELIIKLREYLKNRHFDEYSSLLSKSKLRPEEYQKLGNYINFQNKDDKNMLKISLLKYFPPIDDDIHISYLLSKSKTKNLTSKTGENTVKVKKYYEELNDIPIIKNILQVLQYNQDLKIIFDFDQDSVIEIDPTGDKNVKGRTNFKDSYIFIGAKSENDEIDNKVMGTIAHEFTHLAMEMIFKNDCKPYSVNDKNSESNFLGLNKLLKDEIDKGEEIDQILKAVYKYEDYEWDAELIVRIPHILAIYGNYDGDIKLKNQVPDLYEYFNNNILNSLNEFIENSYLIRPKKEIEYLNLKIGLLNKIEDSYFRLNEPVNIKEFLYNTTSRVLLIKSNETFFSIVSLYQFLNSSYDLKKFNYIISDFDRFIKNKKEIIKHVNSICCNLLIIDLKDKNKNLDFKINFGKILDKIHLIFVCENNYYVEINNYLKTQKNDLETINDREYSFKDLNENSKEILINMQVLFQMKEVKLKDLLGIKNHSQLDDFGNIDFNIFHKLIKIESADYQKLDDLYIERSFKLDNEINEKLFEKIHQNEVFLVIQRDKELKFKRDSKFKTVKYAEFISNHSGIREDEIILLENDENIWMASFEQIKSKINDKNIHLLSYENNKFYWKKSNSNKIEFLKEFLIKDSNSLEYNEEKFIEMIKISSDKIFLISDEAGMGKTTVLTSLSAKIKKDIKNIFVIRIDLNKYTKQLSNHLDDKNVEKRYKLDDKNGAIKFVLSLNLFESEFQKNIAKSLINQSNKMIFLFDGFDEVSAYYKDTVVELIKGLEKYNVKLMITTRPHAKNILENSFSVLAFKLERFSLKEQQEFLVKYWKNNNGKECDESDLKKRADDILESIQSTINNNERELTGIPLQIKMIAEIYDEEKFEIKKLNLKELYEEFINKKIDIYIEIKNEIDKTKQGNKAKVEKDKKEIIESLEIISFINYIQSEKNTNSYSKNFKNKINNSEKYLNNVNEFQLGTSNIGIISEVYDNEIKFIHKTYSEYFIALFIINNFERIDLVEDYLLNEIMVKNEYKIIRLFINKMEIENKKIKINFELKNSFFTIIEENLLNCFKFYSKIEQKEKMEVRNKEGYTGLILASKIGHLKMVDLLIENGADINAKDDDNENTAMLMASEKGHLDIVEILIKKGAIIDSKNKEKNTALISASGAGHIKIVELLILNGANLNEKNSFNFTALISASGNGHLTIVKLLIEKGADINAKDSLLESTALFVASEKGHKDIVKLLIEKGADINSKHLSGYTVLIMEAEKGHLEVVETLIKKGTNLNARDRLMGLSALILASRNGHIDIVKLLIENGADISLRNVYGNNALNFASESGNIEIVKFLIEKGADVNTAVILPSKNGHLEVLKLLIENGADVNAKDENAYTGLIEASRNGHLEIVKFLVEKGANVNAIECQYGNTALILASAIGNLEIVKLLIKNGADVNAKDKKYGYNDFITESEKLGFDYSKKLSEKKGYYNTMNNNAYTALIVSSENGHLEIVKVLIENGADVNAKAKDGYTGLVKACENGHLEIVKLLVENGADVNTIDLYGDTALIIGSIKGHRNIVELLIENGANINSQGNGGCTALMFASEIGYLEIVLLLIEKGADLNAIDEHGNTSLFYATRNNRIQMVELLILKGANVNFKNKNGSTVVKSAFAYRKLDIVKLLIENGADLNSEDNEFEFTVLFFASIHANLDIIKVLIEKGGDLNVDYLIISCFLSVICSKYNTIDYYIKNFFNQITFFNSYDELVKILNKTFTIFKNETGFILNSDLFFSNFSNLIKLIFDFSMNENLPFINYAIQFLIENFNNQFEVFFNDIDRRNEFTFLKNNNYLKHYMDKKVKDSKACSIS